jgi:hypothetical protein
MKEYNNSLRLQNQEAATWQSHLGRELPDWPDRPREAAHSCTWWSWLASQRPWHQGTSPTQGGLLYEGVRELILAPSSLGPA